MKILENIIGLIVLVIQLTILFTALSLLSVIGTYEMTKLYLTDKREYNRRYRGINDN